MSQKWTHEEVKQVFEEEGYTLVSEEYVKAHSKLEVLCSEGHKYKVTWANFQQGYRCPECARIAVGDCKRHSYDYVKQYIEQQDYALLSTEYKGMAVKIKVKCPKGHQYDIRFGDFCMGYRCPYCSGRIVTYEQVKTYIEDEGYKLLSATYKNCSTKLDIKCDEGHQYKATWDKFREGTRCPKCRQGVSEKKLGKIVKALFPGEEIVCQDDLGFLGRQRVDYSVRIYNVAFEYDGEQHFRPIRFNGIPWEEAERIHKEIQGRDKQKAKLCEEQGVVLIHIRYDEDLTKELVRSKLIQEGIFNEVK